MGSSYAEQLALQHIRPCPATASFICSKAETCGCEIINNRSAFQQHLRRNGHKLSANEAADLWTSAKHCALEFPEMHSQRQRYREGYAGPSPLPEIPGLPILRALKCPTCEFLCESADTLRKHGKKAHGASISRSKIRGLVNMPCQSLSRKKDKKLFLVSTEESEDIQTSITRAVASYDPGAVLTRHIPAATDREKSGFVSLAYCEERLDAHNLSMRNAWRLMRFQSAEDDDELKVVTEGLSQVLEDLFVQAREIFRGVDSFRSTLVDIGASGTLEKRRPFRFLENDKTGRRSLQRYARSARVLVVMACRVSRQQERFPGIELSDEQLWSVKELLRVDKEDHEMVKEKVHRLLYSIFFQRSSVGGGSIRLFASAVAACLCVGGERLEKVQYRQGSQVSPHISGILYAASCCALLEIRKYSREQWRDQIEHEIQQMLGTQGKAGVSVFVDLRSICATVRAEETKMHLFHVCRSHAHCGILEGIELSAGAVGDAVRRMQKDLRTSIFQVLLKGTKLPDSFESSCDKMVDDFDSSVPGYWALADFRNSAFVRACNTWLLNNVLTQKSVAEVDVWCRKALDLLPLLLTVVHLSGGAPSRGTELGSMSIRNTHSAKRGFFFVFEEVMIIPTFNKRRAILRGALEFISRHLEKESSFLFKAFFLLIHPVIVGQACVRAQGEAVPDGREGDAILRKRALMTDSVCLGSIAPEDVAGKIGGMFAKYDIPFTFSMYRHWQRGYAKMKGPKSHMGRCLRMETEGKACTESDDAQGVFNASILQAGHSLRTAQSTYAQSSRPGDTSLKAEEDLVELFRVASDEWHEDIWLRSKDIDSPATSFVTVGEPLSEDRIVKIGESVSIRVIGSLSKEGGRQLVDDEDVRENCNVVHRLELEDFRVETALTLSTPIEANGTDAMGSSSAQAVLETAYRNGFEPLQALRKMTRKSDAQFRSEEQRRAMESVARRRSDVAVILSTGCGKTAVVMGPVLYESGVTVWVCPLRALLEETKERLTEAGITTLRAETYADQTRGLGTVLLVAPEEIGLPALSSILDHLSKAGTLTRIVIDEAHIPILSQDYRECMVRLQTLASIKCTCQRVLLTATAPESMLLRISRVCGIQREGLEVIRGDPCRPNLVLNTRRLADSTLETLQKRVVIEVRIATARARQAAYSEGMKDFGARCLIVCLTISDVSALANALTKQMFQHVSVLTYHSKLDNSSRRQSAFSWKMAKPDQLTVMVATEGFCTGTDAPNVRNVIFAGGSRSLVEFWQACGRGGRDGKQAIVTVLFHQGHLVRASAGNVVSAIEGRGSFDNWAANNSQCRRIGIERTLDGLSEYLSCNDRSGNVEACDICRASTTKRNPRAVLSSGSKRPSEEEIGRALKKQKESQDALEAQMHRIRVWGRELSKYCVGCLYVLCTSSDYIQSPEEYFWLKQTSLQTCSDITRCRFTKALCVRCLQGGHRASDCDVLKSVQMTGMRRCRRCFIEGVEGRSIHLPSEFGREGGCPFETCTKLLMMCYRSWATQSSLLAIVPGSRRKSIKNAKDFADWLLNDNVDDPAGIFEAMEWAHKKLKLEAFCKK